MFKLVNVRLSMKYIPILPTSITDLEINEYRLHEIQNLPPKLKKLNMSFNCIDTMKKLPITLEELIIKPLDFKNFLFDLKNLKRLTIRGKYRDTTIHPSNIKFPPNITYLAIVEAAYRYVHSIPCLVKELSLSQSDIFEIKSFPPFLEKLDLSFGQVQKMPDKFPSTTKKIDCRWMKDESAVPYVDDSVDIAFGDDMRCWD